MDHDNHETHLRYQAPLKALDVQAMYYDLEPNYEERDMEQSMAHHRDLYVPLQLSAIAIAEFEKQDDIIREIGSLRPVYPLSPYRLIPKSIPYPDYAHDGIPRSEQKLFGQHRIKILNKAEQEGMRVVCRLAREVLDIAGAAVKPGVTTDYIDQLVHQACVERDSYPSQLNYVHFSKSVCTSVNEAICHGIPDQRPLEDGDIINIDVTSYRKGFHGDINETYYCGEKAIANADAVRVVETARDCLDQSIALVKPGMLFRKPGTVIEKLAKSRQCTTVVTVLTNFHCAPPPPNIPHYAKNKAVGTAKPGMCFTIEPMINIGTYQDRTWPDDYC
ncbi:Methionine aminopeptidase 1 [Penicillium taxi]|uniref:Methionine aminopeptidase 1 n=1 Tax=Penicillium taxi TaxID=168475 RepID=UPI0025451F9D|nr:Methionine aminopeptidase 1 [Penicillium taxi]KAJ5894629.1 Methionine aminopeptidase 1 [Penicillium taxi]